MWRAKFKNGQVIDEIIQKNGKPEERSFGMVLADLPNLESLSIVQGTRTFTVRMEDGLFTVNTSGIDQNFYALDSLTTSSNKLENIRPIYFIRDLIEFKLGLTPLLPEIGKPVFTALGFQANIDGANIKRYLEIFPDGTYFIEIK